MSIYNSKEDPVKWLIENTWLKIASMESAFTRGVAFGNIMTLSHLIDNKLYHSMLVAYEERRKEIDAQGKLF